MAKPIIIGVDLGGTRLRVAQLDAQLNILQREEIPTDAVKGAESVIARIKGLISRMMPADDTPILGIGVSAPGPANAKTGVVVAPPNLNGWHNVPLAKILQDHFNVPVFLGKDANVGALAEAINGAARGCRDVIFITVSTGIGGGIITDGRMLLGRDALGAEVGFITITIDDKVTVLEHEAAGPALARKVRARIEAGENSLVRDLVGGDLAKISGGVVGKAAAQGDAVALSVVQRAGRILGYGVVSLLHLFNPEILVFGGGVSNLGDLLFNPMREEIRKYALDEMYWKDLRIERAALGDNVSLVGAGALVPTQGGVADVSEVIRSLSDN
jgi:glucokinase